MSARLTLALCATAATVALMVPTRTTLAQAQPAATAAGNGLEEIVVTSRRREERRGRESDPADRHRPHRHGRFRCV